MARTLIFRAIALALAGLLLTGAGCKPNRGEFGGKSCPENARMDVPASLLAVYFDKDGNVVGTNAEDMTDTQKNKMCPAAEAPVTPGTCSGGACAITIPALGKTYCKPPPC